MPILPFGRKGALAAVILGGVLVAGCATSPEPFTDEETAMRVQADMMSIFKDQEQVDHAISFEEAVARAIKYNLDYRLKAMERAVAMDEADFAHYSLLPKIAADAGYNYRSNDEGTRKEKGDTPSITDERVHNTAGLDVTWNVLDFGISYIRAKQQTDMALIVEERRRQVVHNIVKDVRAAFWRVVAAERNLPRVEKLLARIGDAMANSEKMLAEAVGDPMKHLAYQKDLLDTLSQLEATKRSLLLAKTHLAALMNIHPGTPYTVSVDDADIGDAPRVPFTMEAMEDIALAQRTELRGEAYQTRVYARESKIAILRMLPGVNLTAGLNWDDDRYQINSTWADMGVSLTWNLLNVIKLPKALDLAENQVEMSKARRLALSMAVISQVHVAGLQHASMVHEYDLAKKRFEVEDRIRAHSTAARMAARGGELEEIRDQVRSIQARLRRDLAYADVQEAYGGLFATMGLDPLPSVLKGDSLEDVEAALSRTFDGWGKGVVGKS